MSKMKLEELRTPKSRGIIRNDKEARTSPIQVPLNAEEKEKLKQIAKSKKMPVATFVRFILNENDCI